jgi:hypothetical protein
MIPGHLTSGIRAAHAEEGRARVAAEAEEESMTPYAPESLAADWEFKIIRSPIFKQFGYPEVRDRVLAEEERAGWVLVEVFDNARIRLKRRRDGRPPGISEGYDPYRTEIPYHPVPATPAQRAAGRITLACLAAGAVVATLYATGALR